MSEDRPNLAHDRSVELANVELNYDRFRELAGNPHLSVYNRTGFTDSQRAGFEEVIAEDILAKLPALAARRNLVLVDVGPARMPARQRCEPDPRQHQSPLTRRGRQVSGLCYAARSRRLSLGG